LPEGVRKLPVLSFRQQRLAHLGHFTFSGFHRRLARDYFRFHSLDGANADVELGGDLANAGVALLQRSTNGGFGPGIGARPAERFSLGSRAIEAGPYA